MTTKARGLQIPDELFGASMMTIMMGTFVAFPLVPMIVNLAIYDVVSGPFAWAMEMVTDSMIAWFAMHGAIRLVSLYEIHLEDGKLDPNSSIDHFYYLFPAYAFAVYLKGPATGLFDFISPREVDHALEYGHWYNGWLIVLAYVLKTPWDHSRKTAIARYREHVAKREHDDEETRPC